MITVCRKKSRYPCNRGENLSGSSLSVSGWVHWAVTGPEAAMDLNLVDLLSEQALLPRQPWPQPLWSPGCAPPHLWRVPLTRRWYMGDNFARESQARLAALSYMYFSWDPAFSQIKTWRSHDLLSFCDSTMLSNASKLSCHFDCDKSPDGSD